MSSQRPEKPAVTRVLILEDSPSDAELQVNALREGAIDCSALRVESREDYERALVEFRPEVILADIRLPAFDGLTALHMARERLPDAPVIVVTGSLPDDVAVSFLRDGASDYILKDRLSRLAPAVLNALAKLRTAHEARVLVESIRQSEAKYRRLFEAAQDGILILDGDSGVIVDANPFLLGMLAYSASEVMGKLLTKLGFPADAFVSQEAFARLQADDYVRYEDIPLQSKDGRRIDVEVVANAYDVNGGRVIQCNIRDISARVAAERELRRQLDELRRFQSVTVDRELRMKELVEENARLKSELTGRGSGT